MNTVLQLYTSAQLFVESSKVLAVVLFFVLLHSLLATLYILTEIETVVVVINIRACDWK